MASELLGDLFTIGRAVAPEELFTTDPTEYYMADVGSSIPAFEPGSPVGIGYIAGVAMSQFPVFDDDSTGTGRLPSSADPPFPPTYPYLFSTAIVYGRDNMNNVLRMVRGDTYTFTGEVELDGSPLNLSGATIKMTAKWSLKDSTNVFQLVEGAGVTVTDAAAGQVTFVIPPSATTSLPDVTTPLKYDIEVITAGGSDYTVTRGELVVFADATV